MIDRDKLLEMRRNADEIALDLEARELALAGDPIAAHEALMQQLRPSPIEKKAPAAVITKRHDNARVTPPQLDDGDDLSPDQIAMLQGITDACAEMISAATAPLHTRISLIEAKLDVLLSLLGGNNTKQIEASEKTIRKLRVR
jgi:hypothetical protein